MFSASLVVALGVVCALAASYVIWRAASRSGLFALLAGVVLFAVVLILAVLIGFAVTRAWFPY